MNIILMLIGVVLVYVILQLVYRKYWSKDLTVDIGFTCEYAVPGQTVYLKEVVTNNKRLPLPYINIKLKLSKNFVFLEKDGNSKISDLTYRNDVFSLLFFQRVTRKLPMKCTKRGVYSLNNLDIVFTGIFMNETMVKQQYAGSQIIVFPEAADTESLKVPFRHIVGNIEKKRYLLQDRFVFRGIRGYESYDSMKDINWKASARAGSLMVNDFDETMSRKVCILLNLEPEGMLKQDMLSEASISIAAGLAQMFIENGIEVALISNGRDIFNKQPVVIKTGSGDLHLNTVNTALATIDLSQDTDEFADMLNNQKKHDRIEGNEDNLYIVISANRRQNLVEAVNNLVYNPEESLWIIPYHNGMDNQLRDCYIPSVKWEVGYDK